MGKPAFLQRFYQKVVYNSEARGSNLDFGQNNWKRWFDSFGGSGKDPDTNQIVSPEIGTRLDMVYSCLNVLAQDIAAFPKQIRQNSSSGKQIINSPLRSLLNQIPNSFENSWHFWYGMIFMGEGWGNSYGYISKRNAAGYATEIIRLKPWAVKTEIIEGELFYVVNEEVAIPSRDIFHYRSFVTDSPFGTSKIDWNSKTMGLKMKQHSYIAKSIGNKPPGILFLKNATAEQVKQNRENWTKQVKGDDIAGTPVLWGDVDYKQMMMTAGDTEIVSQSKTTDESLMGIWRIQPAMLGRNADANYKVEEQGINHVRFTLNPIVTNLEQEMHKLLPESNKTVEFPEYVKFNMNSLLRGDTKSQTEYIKMLVFYGIANGDEIRELLDWPDQPDGLGKKYYHQSSMVEKGKEMDEGSVPQPELDARMKFLLDDFAKDHKLNGYGKKEVVQ